VILVGEESLCANFKNGRFVPYIKGLDPAVGGGADSTAVLERLTKTVVNGRATRSPASSGRQRCLVMRQQLYANCSSAQAMFELTNALLETGIPTVPQEEHMIFSSESVQREEDMFRLGAMEKYERLRRNLAREHDPESAITIHSALLKSGHDCLRCGAFPSLGGQEVLYVSGNQMVRREEVQAILEAYDMVLAPSQHVLTAYLQAGLPRRRGAVIPYGIDPAVYSPEMEPFHYPTRKQFKFLHTSFPWVQEKGFDLTIQAFGRAFSGRDDVSLILRVPKIRDPGVRKSGFDRLDALVKEALAKPDAPEILLMEMDVEPNRRASFYTGADCYVHPLRSEGFGMTILEAMACGLPVIATAWSGPADFLLPQWAYTLRHSSPRAEKAQDGTILRHYVEPELDHLVDLMRHAYEQEAEGKALGQMASAVVRARWTWQHGAARLASLFGLTPQGESATAEFELQQARGHDSRH
jgi:glycosyltransferase involved in cell wall biosynthesis